MHNRIDIDHRHSLAISQEIGERLRASLRVESELPPSIRNRIERLHELEGQSPSIVPTMEHDAGNNDQRPVGTRPGGDENTVNTRDRTLPGLLKESAGHDGSRERYRPPKVDFPLPGTAA